MGIARINTQYPSQPIVEAVEYVRPSCISFDYTGAFINPFLKIDGIDYVYLADLNKGDFITATNTVYLYDGMNITPIACGIFSGRYESDEQCVVLGEMQTKISGYVIGGVDIG